MKICTDNHNIGCGLTQVKAQTYKINVQIVLHVTPRPITTLIGWEDAHKSWYSGRPLP